MGTTLIRVRRDGDTEDRMVSDDNLFPVEVLADRTPRANKWTVTQVGVTTAAIRIAARNLDRKSIAITQITGTQIVYLGPDGSVSASNGQYLGAAAGNSYTSTYTGEIWGLAATSTQTVSVSEESYG